MAVARSPGSGALRGAVAEAAQAARTRPALAVYLLALLTLGWKWLSPLSGFYERAGWSDAFVAAAAAAWLWERIRARNMPRFRAFHLALLLYVAATLLSLAFADARGTGARNVLLVTELAVLALLSSEFGSERRERDAIILVVTALALVTAGVAATGLALFYAGVDTSLIGAYGEQFIPSDNYARISAGFASPALLASFCIFASAVVAWEESPLTPRLRLVTQVALGLLVLSTLSRGVIAFAAALAIRAAWARRSSPWARRAAVAVVLASIALMGALTVGRLHLDPTRPSTITYEVPDPGNRREAFVTGFETLGEHPLTGKGPGSLVGENRGQPFRAHMTPLNVAATVGLPALMALCFLVVVLWRERRRPTPVAAWSGLAGLGIDGLGQDVEHFRHVWVMLGLTDAERQPSTHRSRNQGGRA